MNNKKEAISIMALLASLCIFTVAGAQELRQGQSVVERPRPDFDARGLPLGVFTAFPAVGLGLVYNDNIFATENNEIDDRIAVITPEFIVKADWSRADLEFGADLESARYDDFGSEDYDDWRLWSELGVELGRGRLFGLVRHEELHEQRTSVDDARGIEPTEYEIDIWSVGYRNRFSRLDIRTNVSQKDWSWDDTVTSVGIESNKDRDRQESELSIQLGYDWLPGVLPFIRLGVIDEDFDQKVDDQGFERSSSGYNVVGGAEIDLAGKTVGEVFVGYISRDYDDSGFQTIEDPIFGAGLSWNATGLTTLRLLVDRQIRATTITGASGVVDTGLEAGVDHELLRSLILSLDISVHDQDFEGIDRSDDIFEAQLEGTYMFNRYLQLHIGFNLQDRDTSPADSGARAFDQQSIYVGVRAQI